MKKLYLLLILPVAFNMFLSSANQSFAASDLGLNHWVGESKDKVDYDCEYLDKILKQDKKTFKISQKYIEKLQTKEVKSFAQAVIDKKEKQIKELEVFIDEHHKIK